MGTAPRTVPSTELWEKSCGKTLHNRTGSDETSLPVMALEIIQMPLPRLFLPSPRPLQDKEVAVSAPWDSEAPAFQNSPARGLLRSGWGGGGGERRAAASACAAQRGGDGEEMGGRAQSTPGWRGGKEQDARSQARDRRRRRDRARR